MIIFLDNFGPRYVHHFQYTFRTCHEGPTFHGHTEQNNKAISDEVQEEVLK